MKKIVLATKRHWNWKVFFVLVGLIIAASFAIVPYSLHLQNVSYGMGCPCARPANQQYPARQPPGWNRPGAGKSDWTWHAVFRRVDQA